MLNRRKNTLLKVASFLMAYAVAIPFNGSHLMIGEPQLPKSVIKNSTDV